MSRFSQNDSEPESRSPRLLVAGLVITLALLVSVGLWFLLKPDVNSRNPNSPPGVAIDGDRDISLHAREPQRFKTETIDELHITTVYDQPGRKSHTSIYRPGSSGAFDLLTLPREGLTLIGWWDDGTPIHVELFDDLKLEGQNALPDDMQYALLLAPRGADRGELWAIDLDDPLETSESAYLLSDLEDRRLTTSQVEMMSKIATASASASKSVDLKRLLRVGNGQEELLTGKGERRGGDSVVTWSLVPAEPEANWEARLWACRAVVESANRATITALLDQWPGERRFYERQKKDGVPTFSMLLKRAIQRFPDLVDHFAKQGLAHHVGQLVSQIDGDSPSTSAALKNCSHPLALVAVAGYRLEDLNESRRNELLRRIADSVEDASKLSEDDQSTWASRLLPLLVKYEQATLATEILFTDDLASRLGTTSYHFVAGKIAGMRPELTEKLLAHPHAPPFDPTRVQIEVAKKHYGPLAPGLLVSIVPDADQNRVWALQKYLASGGDDAVLIAMVEHDRFGNILHWPEQATALHFAATYGLADAVAFMLERGWDPHTGAKPGQTPAPLPDHNQVAAIRLGPPLAIGLYHGHEDVATELVKGGADLKAVAEWARPTNYPYQGMNEVQLIASLLKFGLSPDHRYRDGHTLLTHALSDRYVSASDDIVALLVDAGVDPYLAGPDGKRPLEIAQDDGLWKERELLEGMIKNGQAADPATQPAAE